MTRRQADFEEALLNAFEQDNHRHVLSDRIAQVGNIDRKHRWSEIADILAVL